MTTLYLSGPISNDDPAQVQRNLQAFRDAERMLITAGFAVASPLRNGLPENARWEQHMRRDVRMMLADDIDGIATLHNWGASRGAVWEVRIAEAFGIKVAPAAVWLETRVTA